MHSSFNENRWRPREKCCRYASSREDDFDRSTCSGTEASEDERPSRTSSTSVSMPGSRRGSYGESQGQKWGRQLLGMLKTQDDQLPPPPPPPPPLPPPKTKLQSGASLFIPKAALSQPCGQQTQEQGKASSVGSKSQSVGFDKEMLCWEYMHRGYCPRQSTCRWMHPPAESFNNFDYSCDSASGFAPQTNFIQTPYQEQPVFPQPCPQAGFGQQTNTICQGSSYNPSSAIFANHTPLSSCASRFQSQCGNEAERPEPPLSLPLVDLNSHTYRKNDFADLHDFDDETPWPDFVKESRMKSLAPQARSRSETPPVAETASASAKTTQRVSWADIQEDSDMDEPCLGQWQCRTEDGND